MTEQVQKIKDNLDIIRVSREELQNLYLSKQGYLFDSLVFRFKEYQAKAFQHDHYNLLVKGYNDREATKKVNEMHERDLMRFVQILDEAVGEHN